METKELSTREKQCKCPVHTTQKPYRHVFIERYATSNRSIKNPLQVFIIITLSISNARSELHDSTQMFCDSLPNLQSQQRTFCYNNVDIVQTLAEGYKLGHEECQNTFSDSKKTGTRWNCTNMLDDKNKNVFFGVILTRPGTREAGVMESFTAAGMFHNLVRRCQDGIIKSCPPSLLYTCTLKRARSTSDDCKDINWVILTKLIEGFFVNQIKTIRSQVEDHNREIGFRSVRGIASIQRVCTMTKCTERQEVLPLSNLNEILLKAYKNSFKLQKRKLTGGKLSTEKRLKHFNQLLHFRGRYRYCEEAKIWKWPGIGRRPCKEWSADTYAFDYCGNLCCGFGHVKLEEKERYCTTESSPPFQGKCVTRTVIRTYCKYSNEISRKPLPGHIYKDPPKNRKNA